MNQIKFGTSGWRGILAEDFTLENVRIVTQAIADFLIADKSSAKGVVIGHDSRFMGEKFARETARVLAGSNVPSFICKDDTPTPVIAYEIMRRGTAGAINFTASHNPYDYNGIKFSTAWGGPALPEVTAEIERLANAMLGEVCYRDMPLDQAVRAGLVEEIDPMPDYLDVIRSKVDLEAIGKSGMSVIFDPMFGAGREYVDGLLVEAGLMVQTINSSKTLISAACLPILHRLISTISSAGSKLTSMSCWGWRPMVTPIATALLTPMAASLNRTISWRFSMTT